MSDLNAQSFPAISTETLAVLDATFGDTPGGLNEFLSVFERAIQGELTRFLAAVEADQRDAIAKAGHRMAGASLQAGAQSLGEECLRLEQAAKAGDLDTVRAASPRLELLVSESTRQLRAYANAAWGERAA